MIDQHLPIAFLEELTASLREALGQDLVSLYLYGSAVSGGFDARASDVDLLGVIAHDPDTETLERIATFHAHTIQRHRDWAKRLDLVVVARATLASFRQGGRLAVMNPFEPFHLQDGAELWLQNFYLARETGVTLAGPVPTVTIPPISWEEFLAATSRYAEEVAIRHLHESRPGAISYTLLTLSRALCTARSQRPCSKEEGADWVREWMPRWIPSIDAAERCRRSGGLAGFEDDESREAAKRIIGLLRAAVREATPPSTPNGQPRG